MVAGVAQRPAAQKSHQTGVFYDWNKLVRAYPAQGPIVPAHQGFGANDVALHIELGLVFHIELALLYSVVDGGFDGEVSVSVAWRKYRDPIASTVFGVVHRGVGVLQQCGIVIAMLRIFNDANADAQIGIVRCRIEWACHCQQHIFQNGLDIGCRHVFE